MRTIFMLLEALLTVVGHGDRDNNHDYDELEANIMMIMMMMKTTYLKPHCWK